MPLLADLDPPPHGLVTLRARMRRRQKRAAMFAGLVLGPAAATAAVIAVVASTSAPPPFDHPALVQPVGVEVTLDGATVQALPVSENVWLIP